MSELNIKNISLTQTGSTLVLKATKDRENKNENTASKILPWQKNAN